MQNSYNYDTQLKITQQAWHTLEIFDTKDMWLILFLQVTQEGVRCQN